VPKSKLLDSDWKESIFKVKFQYANLTDYHGAKVYFEEKRFSRDYDSERLQFSDPEKYEVLMNHINASRRDETWKIFAPGSLIRKAGFNGWNYNIEKVFKPLQPKLCWFAIYLNLVLEQQPNGEMMSMELMSWGQKKQNPPMEP
jgi:hypothetical protein